MRILLLAACGVILASARRDLDVGVPPGTPLEWDRTLRQPVPTPGRGKVPTTDKPSEKPSGGTVAEERVPKPPEFAYGNTNLYDFFRVTTQDIMQHASLNLPKSTGRVSIDETDVATGGGGGFRMTWNYPPELPVELAWMATMACIRTEIHPEIVSEPESIVYAVELGIPAHYGAKAYPGKIGSQVAKATVVLPPQPPELVKMKDPRDAMLARLAMVELTSGYAYALDPTFARRTLGLGADSYRAVLECTKSRHPLLAQNAVAVLANFPNPEAGVELRKIFQTTPDSVCRYRALSGLLRRRDRTIVPDLVKAAGDKDEVLRCAALYALGMLADPATAPVLCQTVRNAGTRGKDLLWSALPALARVRDGTKETREILAATEKALRGECKGGDKVRTSADAMTPTAEAPGSKVRVLRQMALLALAANGDPGAGDEVLQRLASEGSSAFHPTVWYLVAEVAAHLGDKGVEQVKKMVEVGLDDSVHVHALRSLVQAGKADAKYLRDRASKGSPVVRGAAIQFLADTDEKSCVEVCRATISDFAKGSGSAEAEAAFLVAIAAQVGGKIGAWKDGVLAADLAQAGERAWKTGAYARREGKNDPDITKCRITVHPALLETLLVECGRGAGEKAVDLLVKILKDRAKPAGRAEAALALGGIGGKPAVEALLATLEDPDGWVRYCAYLSLKHLSAQEYFTDWIFASAAQCKTAADKYRAWFRKNPPK